MLLNKMLLGELELSNIFFLLNSDRLWHGKWPLRDWNGKLYTEGIDFTRAGTDLADGYFGAVWVIKNDLEMLWKTWNLPNCGSNDPCAWCPADCRPTSVVPVHDYREGSAWMNQVYTKAQWRASAWNQHPIFTVPGVTILTVWADLMHAKHMGTDMYFYASVLVLLCYDIMRHAPEDNCALLWMELKEIYERDKVPDRLSTLQLSMFCSVSDPHKSMPKLKPKSAESRHLDKPLLEMWLKRMDARNIRHVQIRLALESSVEIETVLNHHSTEIRLPPDAYEEFKKHCFRFLTCFNALARYYSMELAPPRLLFDITFKAHALAHGAVMFKWLNPRLGWCYAGEDFMQTCRRLMGACVRGNRPMQATIKFVDKYRFGMHMEFSECRM